MKHLRHRLTYANVMSSIAVFLVLGGVAAAAIQLPKNSVGSKQLKNNAVTGAKVKNHSLTGQDIKLNALGTVPSATNAVNATNAAHATTAGSSEEFKTWFATASIGQTVSLLTIGPFTYTGECKEASGGPYAQTWVETSQEKSAADSYADEGGYETHSSEENPWNPGHRVSVGYYAPYHSSSGESGWTGPYDGSDTQISGDGHTYVNTFAAVGVKVLGADCVFTGHAFVLNR